MLASQSKASEILIKKIKCTKDHDLASKLEELGHQLIPGLFHEAIELSLFVLLRNLHVRLPIQVIIEYLIQYSAIQFFILPIFGGHVG
jgi:hypothetical protein